MLLNHMYFIFYKIKQRIAFVYMVIALIEALTVKLRPAVLNPGHLAIFKAYRWQW